MSRENVEVLRREGKGAFVLVFRFRKEALDAVGLSREVMSRENVDVVRRSLEAYQRGDLDLALVDAHPEIVWNPFEEAPMRGVHAVRTYLTRWESEWEELETTPEEFIDAGDHVVAIVHFRGRGRGSGIEVDARSYMVYTVRDGRTVAMEEFIEREEAAEPPGCRSR